MATGEIDRASLIAAYRVAHAAPPSRAERVLARLRAPSDYAVLLPDARSAPVWPMVVLAIAAAVLAVFALEAVTGKIAGRLGRAERFEAVDQPIDATKAVREAAIAGGDAATGARPRAVPGAVVPAELPAELPPLLVPPPPVAAPVVEAAPPLQRPMAVRPRTAAPPPEVVATAAPEPTPPEPDREAALLEQARAAVARRGWVDARTALTKHRAEFPSSELGPERDALEIVVACRTDPGEATRARGREFIVHHGRSPYLRMVVAACRGSTPTVVSPFD